MTTITTPSSLALVLGLKTAGLIEGATENAAVVQAPIDNLIERGLDPKVCRLFIIDGAKALSKVIRRTFGAGIPELRRDASRQNACAAYGRDANVQRFAAGAVARWKRSS